MIDYGLSAICGQSILTELKELREKVQKQAHDIQTNDVEFTKLARECERYQVALVKLSKINVYTTSCEFMKGVARTALEDKR